MSRMRVHELAKELGLPSKELLQKMQQIGFSDKNHMSYLSAEEVDQVRAFADASPTTLKLEESRISGGVIRRRRKIVTEEPPPAEPLPPRLTPPVG